MNKSDIISAISIEFILSKEEAEKIINVIFQTISKSLKQSHKLDIPKLGEFKVVSSGKGEVKSVRFSPSKKLSKRVNTYFDDLEKTELHDSEPEVIKYNEEFNYRISQEFLDQKREYENSYEEGLTEEEENNIPVGADMKKLISEELLKLHQEIIELSNNSERGKNNLWG